jgi:hypothetical protein
VFGSGRLFDNNEGPNVKLSFDGFRAIAEGAHARLDLFALKPVTDAQGYFDDIKECGGAISLFPPQS